MSGLSFHWLRQGGRGRDVVPILNVQNLFVKVGVREVLSDINLEVYPEDHIQVTGPNGCGKSSLFNAIAGVGPSRIISGRIFFTGKDITFLPSHERAAMGIVYMRQTNNVFPNLSISENLELALGKDGYYRFEETFPEWTADLPKNKRAGQLSGGQKKKLAWAMSCLVEKKLFIADEPEAGVSCSFKVPEIGNTYLFIQH